ncbi:unnamed protein product [Urochloa humidicola]
MCCTSSGAAPVPSSWRLAMSGIFSYSCACKKQRSSEVSSLNVLSGRSLWQTQFQTFLVKTVFTLDIISYL